MSLKVFDLQCVAGHVFEGWFASADAYETQRQRGLLTCPVCESHEVSRMLSAPRLNMGKGREAPAPQSPDGGSAVAGPSSEQLARMQAQLLMHMREIVRQTDNVGDRFAAEARRMHEGEIEPRAIRGTATAQEREELARDGISAVAIPDFLDDDRLQ